MKNHRRLALTVSLLIITTAVFATEKANLFPRSSSQKVAGPFNSDSMPVAPANSTASTNETLSPPAETQSGTAISKHVVYGLLFREMAAFKRKAQDLEAQGKDGSVLRNYHRNRANLDDARGAALDKVAADCQKTVDDLEQQAKKIIDKDRAAHPGGRLRQGEALPKPPPQLKELEQRRTAAIMSAREKLHTAFGDKEFQRFDDFEQQDVTSRAKPLARPPHPVTPGNNSNPNKP